MSRRLSLHSFHCLCHEVVARHLHSFHLTRTPITHRTTLSHIHSSQCIMDGQDCSLRSLRLLSPLSLRSPRQPPPQHPHVLDERLLVGFAAYNIASHPRPTTATPINRTYAGPGAGVSPITNGGSQAPRWARSHAQQRGANNRLRCERTAFHERPTTRATPTKGRKNPVDARPSSR